MPRYFAVRQIGYPVRISPQAPECRPGIRGLLLYSAAQIQQVMSPQATEIRGGQLVRGERISFSRADVYFSCSDGAAGI
jgi:hypothetical protein